MGITGNISLPARLLFALGLCLPSFPVAGDLVDCSLVPGWQQEQASRHYTADNLFEYLDGGAESYLLYGFKQLQGVTCTSAQDSLVIDASEMADPVAAYGIFSSNLDTRLPLERIGMGGQVMPERCTFAKGNFYVELTATPDRDHTPALRAFAAALEKRIRGRTKPPDEITWFVPAKLVAVRLIPESVLGLPDLRRGFVAQYERGQAFLVAESSGEAAQAVLAKLRQRYPEAQPAQVGDEAILALDKYLGWVCFFRRGKYLGGYANSPDDSDARGNALGLVARLP